ncbi:MAG: B12-binding domain-containing radical SAM protein [Theionarchaea archaeon]|nr:MAG: hypothetical protein AYK18_01950 [Theionarchaea archaeon DG-70]MBU7011262.1 B12-binding domain-containing radical SAM protein [Theionarchaea archaeon]
MKTLLVKPGSEIVEKTLKGPWPPQLSHLEKLYKEPVVLFRGLFALQAAPQSAPLAVGSTLERLGEDVEYLDVPLEFGLPLNEEFNEKRHRRIEDYIAKGGYDVVGISCASSSDCVATQQIAEAAKRALDDVIVIAGGYQAATEAFDLMEKIPSIDVIALSDFEPIAEQLYSSFNGNFPLESIPNITYREDGKICVSERKHPKLDPEDLPIFDYSLLEKYIPLYSLFVIEASRGCPYACSFCQEKTLRKHYTKKDVAVTVDELIDNANYLGQFVDSVFFLFCDPLWGANTRWVKRFCSQLSERRDDITPDKFGWMVETRVGQFSGEALSLMKKAGCTSIAYGVESLSPKMLQIMNKTEDPHQYIASVFESVEKALKEDMRVLLLYILGLPGETPSTIEETFHLVRNLPLKNRKLHIGFSLAYPLRGTLLDKQIHDPHFVEKYGVRLLGENDWEKAYFPHSTLLFDPSAELSASELTDFYLQAYQGRGRISRSMEAIMERDEIHPGELAEYSQIFSQNIGMSR